jgi:hypothetical protein
MWTLSVTKWRQSAARLSLASTEPPMTQYRIYVLNDEDRIAQALMDRFVNDNEALEHAEDVYAGQYAAEVWEGERLVGRIGGELQID